MAAGKIFTMIKNLVKKKKGVDAYLKSKASKQIANKKFKVKAERESIMLDKSIKRLETQAAAAKTTSKDPQKLADSLQWLIEQPQERIAMGKAGRIFAEKEFPIEKIVQDHLETYQQLLKKVL